MQEGASEDTGLTLCTRTMVSFCGKTMSDQVGTLLTRIKPITFFSSDMKKKSLHTASSKQPRTLWHLIAVFRSGCRNLRATYSTLPN